MTRTLVYFEVRSELSLVQMNDERRQMVRSAAGIYAGAALIGLFQLVSPHGAGRPPAPSLAALAIAVAIAATGPWLPRPALAALGPLGAALIALSVAQTHVYGDGAILYVWPALWMALFFGLRGACFIVLWIGLVHAVALLALPNGEASLDRWIDVEVAVVVVVVVIRVLATRNARLLRELADQARTDPLTGLLNRRGFDERMRVELARAIRSRSSLALVTFDLDHFKRVNDEFGHEAGDHVLARVGDVIAGEVRAIDVAARVGGEEFVVVLPDADAGTALPFAERVRLAIGAPAAASRPGQVPSARPHVTVSGGVACAVGPIDVDQLLDAADRALYRAKHEGRDRIVVDERHTAPCERRERVRSVHAG